MHQCQSCGSMIHLKFSGVMDGGDRLDRSASVAKVLAGRGCARGLIAGLLARRGVYIELHCPIFMAIAIQTPSLPRRLLVFHSFLLYMHLVASSHYKDVRCLSRVSLSLLIATLV